MTRKDKIDEARANFISYYLDDEERQTTAQLDEEIAKYTQVVLTATDDPEPQADDVETIRDALDELNGIFHKVQSIEHNETYTDGEPEWDTCRTLGKIKDISCKATKALTALTRLSAPVDVQAKAEAVVDAFSDTYYELSACQRIELTRLIVEQFSRKG
jgi:hypothetical protein